MKLSVNLGFVSPPGPAAAGFFMAAGGIWPAT